MVRKRVCRPRPSCVCVLYKSRHKVVNVYVCVCGVDVFSKGRGSVILVGMGLVQFFWEPQQLAGLTDIFIWT